jgi:DNA-binding NarL/FixJ family response regulator
MKQLRIVVADDSEMIRRLVREALAEVEGLMAVGEAADGAQAYWLYNQMYPDVLILDLTMPKASGLEVLQCIRKKDKSTIIIVFTADPALALREACLEAGASFYLDKSELNVLIGICQNLQRG